MDSNFRGFYRAFSITYFSFSLYNKENEFWGKTDEVTVECHAVGSRPAGTQSKESSTVQAALAATVALGFEPVLDDASSTDSNVPIHLGVPAVTLGGGGDAGGFHTLDEYFDPTDAYYGVQKVFLTILGLLGCQGVSNPLLDKR